MIEIALVAAFLELGIWDAQDLAAWHYSIYDAGWEDGRASVWDHYEQ